MSPRSALCVAALALLLLPIPAHAQLFRTYLSSTGSDSNPCTLQAPCRLLPAALSVVAGGGDVWILDSANYNHTTVHITKSANILAVPGAVASVVANGAPAINIATPGVRVSLRNLVIAPLVGTGDHDGISMTAGTRLVVQNCVIANITGTGILVTTPAVVLIADTTVRDGEASGVILRNGARVSIVRSTISGNDSDGVSVNGIAAGSTTTVDISDSILEGNNFGLFANSINATAVVKVNVVSSSLSRNDVSGADVLGVVGPVTVAIARSTLTSNNGSGLSVSGVNARATLSASIVSNNLTGLTQGSSATLETAGNNTVRNNTNPDAGTITNVGTQ